MVSGVLTIVRDASRMLLDRSAMEAASRFIAWKTGSKAAQSQWVVGPSLWSLLWFCEFNWILGSRMVLWARVWGKGGVENVVVIVIIGKLSSSSSSAAAVASLAADCFGLCVAGSGEGLLSRVGVGGVGKNGVVNISIVGRSSSKSVSSGRWCGVVVARMLAARAARSMRGGGGAREIVVF